jgi:hypothetical protein
MNSSKHMILRHTLPRLVAALLFACAVQAVSAAERGFAFYTDQDLAIPFLNEDRDYTMGAAVEFFWEQPRAYPLDPALARIAEWFGFHSRGDAIIRSFMLGSINYTPDNLARDDVIHGDRPYASVVYFANKRVRANDDTAAGVELQVGVLGSSPPGKLQRALHRGWRKVTGENEPVDPAGWRHQVSDGGELTGRLRFAYSRLWREGGSGFRRWDLAQSADVTLGYQTNASVTLAGRFGAIKSPFWSLPYDPINRGNFVPQLVDRDFYAWAALRGRAVVYDALLQGQFRDSDLTYGGGSIERMVLEGGVGLTATWLPIQVTLAINGKSAELDADLASRHHFWGGLYIVARF